MMKTNKKIEDNTKTVTPISKQHILTQSLTLKNSPKKMMMKKMTTPLTSTITSNRPILSQSHSLITDFSPSRQPQHFPTPIIQTITLL